ncbi:cation:proton antiporter [Candidatus Pacearchaeota archaeon]|nr:cation:proton antiporter [Candidatus Pacearchaeota archaeon]
MPDFFDLLVLMVIIWTMGHIFKAFRLPVVFGEVVGGILAGPMLLGIVHTDSEMIKVLAELGIFFLMLHAGLETDHEELFKSSKKSVLVAIGGVVVPFAMGYYTALYFGQPHEAALFIAMGLSISALALAARLFKDYNIHKTRAAHMTMGAAIIDDIVALILFSLILNLAETGRVELLPMLFLLIKVVLFFAIVIYTGLKSAKFLNRIINIKTNGFTLTLIIALLMGYIAEAIGLHMIIGAFLAGLFMHEEVIDKKVFAKIEDRVYGLSYGFFGPIFFASLAFHLDLTAFKTAPFFLLAITGVAIIGKVLGSGLVAKWLKMSNVESMVIGLAMNNRGAVELIIASIGLQKGIIDQNVFSILVIMAFATTMFSILTTPIFAKKLKH